MSEDGLVITEFRLDHPILRRALAQTPGMTITWERSDPIDDDRIRVLLWAGGDDFDAFEDALADDPTVTPPRREMRFGERRLYQLDLVGEGRRTSIYPLLVEHGGIIHELTASHDGWEFRVAFPDYESFTAFREFCEQRDIGFALHSVYVQEDSVDATFGGLTPRQRELLLVALDAGYFEIPRAASLADVAADVGISANAASERFRRGMHRLVRQLRDSTPPADRPFDP